MSTAAELWTEYQALKAEGAMPVLRGHAYERWFAQAIREGNDPSRLRRDAPTISERIDARTIEGLDGCLIWDGRLSYYNQPIVTGPKKDGGHEIHVRRWLLKRAGQEPPPRRRIYSVCGNHRCVTLDHLRFEEKHWGRRSSNEDMIARLQVFALRIGHTPSSVEWEAARQKPASSTYGWHFGGWPKALQAAGLAADLVEHPRTPLAERSHCVHGHPVSPETLEPNGHGRFRCKTCRIEKRARRNDAA